MEYKLFVGNIPFDCKLFEFRNVLKKCNGYINADLINISNSKCFGFIVLKNKECLEELLITNNVFLKDRKLRFTRYNMNTNNSNSNLNNTNNTHNTHNTHNTNNINNINTINTINNIIPNNYLKLYNIPCTIKTDDIKKEFENYSQIGKCFIDMDRLTGEYKTTGIIEILEIDIYEKFLNLDTIIINDITINISKYDKGTLNSNLKPNIICKN